MNSFDRIDYKSKKTSKQLFTSQKNLANDAGKAFGAMYVIVVIYNYIACSAGNKLQ